MRRARIKVAPNFGARSAKLEAETTQQEAFVNKEPVSPCSENQVIESSSNAENLTNKPTLLQKLGRFRVKPNVNPSRTSQLLSEKSTSDALVSNSECVECNNQLPCLSPVNDITEPTQISPNKPIEASLVVTNLSNVSPNTEIVDISSHVEVQTQLSAETNKGTQETKKGEEITNDDQIQNQSGWSRLKPRVTRVRPNIEGASLRVRTLSSASESEDETKRQNRIHSTSNTRSVANSQSNKVRLPEKEHAREEAEPKVKKKSEERSQLDIRKEDMRRKFMKGQVELKQMTMFDLIYYNPDGERPTRSKEKLVTRRRVQETGKQNVKAIEVSSILEEKLAEEEEERRIMEQEEEVGEGKENQNQTGEVEEDAMPVPQVRLGPNGEIILDEKSLVIETSEAIRSKMKMADAPVVVENSAGLVNYGSWRTRKRSPKWSIKETARFYRALSMLGTDFSLMESLFPRRTRFELKRKFKIEEKINRPLIDRTIETQKPFDPTVFGDETGSEEEYETASVEEVESKKRKKKKDTNGIKRRKTKSNSTKEIESEASDRNQCTWSRDTSHDTTSLPAETSADSEVSSQDGQLSTLLQSPLGQMSLEKGGVTVVEQTQSSLPSFVVPTALTKENPVFANAQPGSLVVVTTPNPNDPDHQLLHVYRISTTVEQPLT